MLYITLAFLPYTIKYFSTCAHVSLYFVLLFCSLKATILT